jgi:hypothetical protein
MVSIIQKYKVRSSLALIWLVYSADDLVDAHGWSTRAFLLMARADELAIHGGWEEGSKMARGRATSASSSLADGSSPTLARTVAALGELPRPSFLSDRLVDLCSFSRRWGHRAFQPLTWANKKEDADSETIKTRFTGNGCGCNIRPAVGAWETWLLH